MMMMMMMMMMMTTIVMTTFHHRIPCLTIQVCLPESHFWWSDYEWRSALWTDRIYACSKKILPASKKRKDLAISSGIGFSAPTSRDPKRDELWSYKLGIAFCMRIQNNTKCSHIWCSHTCRAPLWKDSCQRSTSQFGPPLPARGSCRSLSPEPQLRHAGCIEVSRNLNPISICQISFLKAAFHIPSTCKPIMKNETPVHVSRTDIAHKDGDTTGSFEVAAASSSWHRKSNTINHTLPPLARMFEIACIFPPSLSLCVCKAL